jgi:hypothetical protein
VSAFMAGERAHIRPSPLPVPLRQAATAGNFTRPLLPETAARSPRGEVSAFMIEIALRHPRAAMAGAPPAPLEKTS